MKQQSRHNPQPPPQAFPVRGEDHFVTVRDPIDVSRLCATLVPALVRRNAPRALVDPPLPRGENVRDFVAMLLDEDDTACEARLLDICLRGGDPQAAAAGLLAPAARLVGDYWRIDVVDFMKVTVTMTRIQRLFWSVACAYPPRAEPRAGRTALLTLMTDEQHGFGMSIVEDALLRAGWQVDCCGVGEEDQVNELLAANNYAVVGVSLAGSALAPGLPGFVRRLRRNARNNRTRILVGGAAFVERPAFAYEAGADFLALDARSAVRVAETAAEQVLRGS